jgi:amidase
VSPDVWRLGAVDVAEAIGRRDVSCREATTSVLERIDATNDRVNALPEVLADEALTTADAADQALARREPTGPLHGVPVTIKVNVDQAGRATTNGIVGLRDLVADSDSPPVANLKHAGAVIVGRSNTPAFSLRWFTDNDVHGRTLNPWDPGVTPGGSSGGAAAAAALGMGPIAHGNDYGGSIRYPAWACGVVGLRPTVGRVPAYNATGKEERGVSSQLMAVQGPLTRTVADARLALAVMARGDSRDPLWVPAPLDYPDDGRPLQVALLRRHAAFDAETSVVEALEQAASWLVAAGCNVDEVEPPHFADAAELWCQLVYDDLRRSVWPAIEAMGDAAVKTSLRFSIDGRPQLDRDGYLDGLARRLAIVRAWSVFLQEHAVLLMPISWQRAFPVDDDTRTVERMNEIIAAQSPLLATAILGLPGLAVPTGVADGLPTGVQLVSSRYREDLCLRAGEIIERAAGFSALEALTP